jgi:hypothetical protein
MQHFMADSSHVKWPTRKNRSRITGSWICSSRGRAEASMQDHYRWLIRAERTRSEAYGGNGNWDQASWRWLQAHSCTRPKNEWENHERRQNRRSLGNRRMILDHSTGDKTMSVRAETDEWEIKTNWWHDFLSCAGIKLTRRAQRATRKIDEKIERETGEFLVANRKLDPT